MDTQSDKLKRKPLVTVEFQTEFDIATGNREQRMFVKMYFEARDSGLLAALPDDLWKTLCCLATYIDELGMCCPSQKLLAEYLGVSRQIVNQRINRLLAFRFNGEPVICMSKNRESKKGGSRWANNVYQLRPISGFAMFADQNEQKKSLASPETPKNPANTAKSSMSTKVDIEVSGQEPLCQPLCQHVGDTNQIEQEKTKTLNVNGFKKAFPEQQAESSSLPSEDEIRIGSLVIEMLDVCRDRHSRAFYRLVAEKVPAELIRAALSETKYQANMGRIRKSRGAFFTDEIQRLARERGIEFRLTLPGQNKSVSSL